MRTVLTLTVCGSTQVCAEYFGLRTGLLTKFRSSLNSTVAHGGMITNGRYHGSDWVPGLMTGWVLQVKRLITGQLHIRAEQWAWTFNTELMRYDRAYPSISYLSVI